MSKLTYGVGYNSKRKYKARKDGKTTRVYQAWQDMLRRCYHPKFHEKQPTYLGCSVDERFHDFQDFADWYYSQPYNDMGYQLDKDLLVHGNNVYSPDTCSLVPQELNHLLTSRSNRRGKYPQGVSWNKLNGVFHAEMSMDGKRIKLGSFDNPSKAYQVYKTAKERHVKNKALEWANRIDRGVFAALMSWQLEN